MTKSATGGKTKASGAVSGLGFDDSYDSLGNHESAPPTPGGRQCMFQSGSDVDSSYECSQSMFQVRVIPPTNWKSAPDDTFVSVHVGQTVKHKRLGKVHNFRFQDTGESGHRATFGRVEIYKRVGYTTVSLHAGENNSFQDIEVPCEDPGFRSIAPDGKIRMKFAVKGAGVPLLSVEEAASRLKLACVASTQWQVEAKKVRRKGPAADPASQNTTSSSRSVTFPAPAGPPAAPASPNTTSSSRTVTFPAPAGPDVDRSSMRRALGMPAVEPSLSATTPSAGSALSSSTQQQRVGAPYMRLPSVATWYMRRSESAPPLIRKKKQEEQSGSVVLPKPSKTPFASATLQQQATLPMTMNRGLIESTPLETTLRPVDLRSPARTSLKPASNCMLCTWSDCECLPAIPAKAKPSRSQSESPWYAQHRPTTPTHEFAQQLTDVAKSKSMQLQELRDQYRKMRAEVKVHKKKAGEVPFLKG